MNEPWLRDALRRTRPPGEARARERTRSVVMAADDGAAARPRRRRLRAAVPVGSALMLVLVAGAVASTPPGDAVTDWVRDLVGRSDPAPHPSPALSRLPAAGRLLVSGPGGAWIVRDDGGRRRLGPYTEATWSPNGLFVAAVRERQLVALDPRGRVRWALSRSERIHDVRWAPSGYRVAYRAGSSLRVVAGDGSADRRIAARVRDIAPAWRSAKGGNELTYVDTAGRIVVVDVDSGRRISRFRAPIEPRRLAWSPSGRRLLIGGDRAIRLTGVSGSTQTAMTAPLGARYLDARFSPDGRRLAILRRSEATPGHDVLVVASAGGRPRSLFTATGPIRSLTWSPGGRLLLADWVGADQWLFLPIDQQARASAVAGVAGQFDLSRSDPRGAVDIEGWCCR